MYPQCKRNFNNPTKQLIQMYQLTWIMTELVQLKHDPITNKYTLEVHKPIIHTYPNPLITNPQGFNHLSITQYKITHPSHKNPLAGCD